MKKIILITLCLLIAIPGFSEDKRKWFKRKKKAKEEQVVHDTIYVFVEVPTDTTEILSDVIDPDRMAIDTLDTKDKFTKVILFDDNSYSYFDLGKPIISDTLSSDHWSTTQVHAYKDVSLKEIPDEIDLVLVDSLHSWHIPAEGKILSNYRFRSGREHHGVDIKVALGDPIYAAFDGVVRSAMPSRSTGGYGNAIVIRHMNGLETYYAHLSKYLVGSGDLVKAGEIIGYGGATGRATGTHLHFETRYMGQSFDPERIFDFQNETLRDSMLTLKKHYFSIYSHNGQSDAQSKEASGRITYVIKSGDTLGAIARKYGTTVDKLCRLNKLSKTTTLRIGQRIIIR